MEFLARVDRGSLWAPSAHQKEPNMTSPTILLTGATGFIGGATLTRLLETNSDAKVLVLARDRGSDAAAERVTKSLERFVGPAQAEAAMCRCEVIRADLTDPESLGTPRLDDATHVIHVAAEKK